MRFPIIKVKDSATNREHIVGTNSHDQLKIDNGQTIYYYNLQNGEGSRFGDYSFKGKECDYEGVTVEFVTFEELKEIYSNQCAEDLKSAEIRKDLFEALLAGEDD